MKSILVAITTVILCCSVFGIAAAEAADVYPPARPQRVVSLNLCADQFLIALADKSQIAALSKNARDKQLSYYADRATEYPISANSAESIVALNPDLIISNKLRYQHTQSILRDHGYKISNLTTANSYKEIIQQIRLVADWVGYPERGEALIAEMNQALSELQDPANIKHPTIVHYQRRGFVTGGETLLDEIMEHAGYKNIARVLGTKKVTRVSLESIIKARPDYLLLTTKATTAEDIGAEVLQHPALAQQFPDNNRLYIPESYISCGGPSYSAAVAMLHKQRRD